MLTSHGLDMCSYCVFTSPLQSVATSNHHAPDLIVTAALNQSWLRNFLIRFIPPTVEYG